MKFYMPVLLVVSTVVLLACSPIPGFGPPFGPDAGASVLLLGVIGLMAYGVKRLRDEQRQGGRGSEAVHNARVDTAKSVIRDRYAKGEIGREEYFQLLKDLAQK